MNVRIIRDDDVRRIRSLPPPRPRIAARAGGGGSVSHHPSHAFETFEDSLVVEASQIPADVVTLHSQVMLEDDRGGRRVCMLALCPDPNGDERVLAIDDELGASIFGRRAGESVAVGSDPHRRVLILGVPYQPEAAGHWHR